MLPSPNVSTPLHYTLREDGFFCSHNFKATLNHHHQIDARTILSYFIHV